jgi:hypothetical protein
MNVELTKDADTLICLLYKAYIEKRESGVSKANAKSFGGSDNIHQSIVPSWPFDDVDETCRELDRAGLLNCQYADNIVYFANLPNESITYMEGRFGRKLGNVLDYIKKLPFV